MPVPSSRPQGKVQLFGDLQCPEDETGEAVVCARPMTDDGIRALHLFASCLADRHPANVRRALLPGEGQRGRLEKLVGKGGRCAPGGALRFSADLLAGALAEALLRRGPGRDALVRRLAYDPAQPPIRAVDEGDFLGLCMARTASEEVIALLQTVPATDEEREAFRPVIPRLSACLPPGREVRLTRPALRAALSIGAFRLSV